MNYPDDFLFRSFSRSARHSQLRELKLMRKIKLWNVPSVVATLEKICKILCFNLMQVTKSHKYLLANLGQQECYITNFQIYNRVSNFQHSLFGIVLTLQRLETFLDYLGSLARNWICFGTSFYALLRTH